MGRPISVMRMQSGRLALCPCGGVLLKVEQPPVSGHIQSRSTAGSERKPDIPPSLAATLLWQPACCGCLTVVAQGFLFSVVVVVLGISVSKIVVPSHWHWSLSAEDALHWSQSTDTRADSGFLTRLEWSLVLGLCWKILVSLTLVVLTKRQLTCMKINHLVPLNLHWLIFLPLGVSWHITNIELILQIC